MTDAPLPAACALLREAAGSYAQAARAFAAASAALNGLSASAAAPELSSALKLRSIAPPIR